MTARLKPWQYRLLFQECHSVSKTARLLRLNPQEAAALINRRCQATLRGWYHRARLGCSPDTRPELAGVPCWGAPVEPDRLRNLARKLVHEDYPGLFEEGEVENLAVAALRACLRSFRADLGDPSVPVQKRFAKRFQFWFKKGLAKEARRRGRRGRHRPRLRLDPARDDVSEPAWEGDAGAPYEVWAWHLYRLSVPRLSPRLRLVLESRLRGVRDGAIALRLGISSKTLSNTCSRGRVVRAVRRAVRGLVRGLTPGERQAVIDHLLRDAGLNPVGVARLLCLTPGEVRAGPSPGMEPEEAMALFTRRGGGPGALPRCA